jgi:uncharacterized protein YqjF (DUF2071 family)
MREQPRTVPVPRQIPGSKERIFLTAEWRYVAMLNYQVDPALLAPRLPTGTELDLFEGKAFVSLVGFRFLSTRLFRIPIPFHRDFDEVNLRFYVRRREAGTAKRGVVFVQEIVPRLAISTVARLAYRENYRCLPMTHEISLTSGALRVQYTWRLERRWNRLTAHAAGAPREMAEGSAEQFIAEHYWGYCAQPGGGCLEYHVAHPPWRVWDVSHAEFAGDAEALYGAEFAAVLNKPPDSAFLAEGSPVTLFAGKRIER